MTKQKVVKAAAELILRLCAWGVQRVVKAILMKVKR